MKFTDLKKGDIFKYGSQPWNCLNRFHSLEVTESGRINLNLMAIGFNGDVETCFPIYFTYREKDQEVFIPKFFLSENRNSKGRPCIPVNTHRNLLPSNLNEINKSDKYCEGNQYHHCIAEII